MAWVQVPSRPPMEAASACASLYACSHACRNHSLFALSATDGAASQSEREAVCMCADMPLPLPSNPRQRARAAVFVPPPPVPIRRWPLAG
eukprot:scaffold8877_cov112-Isochrysis_galbana.AAC.9